MEEQTLPNGLQIIDDPSSGQFMAVFTDKNGNEEEAYNLGSDKTEAVFKACQIWGIDFPYDDDGSENVGVFMNDDGKQSGYRWDGSTGTLYEWSQEHRCYLFVAKGNGKTEQETIKEYEEYLMYSE